MNVTKVIFLIIILGIGGCSFLTESFSRSLSQTEVIGLENKNISTPSSDIITDANASNNTIKNNNINIDTSMDAVTNIDINTTTNLSTNVGLSTNINLSHNIDSNEKPSLTSNSNENDKTTIYSGILIPLIVVLITNGVVLWKTVKENKLEIKRKFYFDKMDFTQKKLNDFYNPILTLLKTNSDIFNSMGPNTYENMEGLELEEAGELWDNMVRCVILPNNKSIVKIIKEKSYLISTSDSLDIYLDYVKHAESFSLFKKHSYSSHKKFIYPVNIINHVSHERSLLFIEYNNLIKSIEP